MHAIEAMNARPEQQHLIKGEAMKMRRHLPLRKVFAQSAEVLGHTVDALDVGNALLDQDPTKALVQMANALSTFVEEEGLPPLGVLQALAELGLRMGGVSQTTVEGIKAAAAEQAIQGFTTVQIADLARWVANTVVNRVP
jgi:hypothetical protein